jgi:hypothetical protein
MTGQAASWTIWSIISRAWVVPWLTMTIATSGRFARRQTGYIRERRVPRDHLVAESDNGVGDDLNLFAHPVGDQDPEAQSLLWLHDQSVPRRCKHECIRLGQRGFSPGHGG